jgi:hypothetical protein
MIGGRALAGRRTRSAKASGGWRRLNALRQLRVAYPLRFPAKGGFFCAVSDAAPADLDQLKQLFQSE